MHLIFMLVNHSVSPCAFFQPVVLDVLKRLRYLNSFFLTEILNFFRFIFVIIRIIFQEFIHCQFNNIIFFLFGVYFKEITGKDILLIHLVFGLYEFFYLKINIFIIIQKLFDFILYSSLIFVSQFYLEISSERKVIFNKIINHKFTIKFFED